MPYQSALDYQLQQRRNQLSGRSGVFSNYAQPAVPTANVATTAPDAAGQAAANREELYGLARGRVGELRGDPVDQLVIDQLRQRATGAVGPYDETTRNALFTGQSDMAAHAQQQAVERLNRQGLSAGDPAYQAAMNEINAQRQATLQGAKLNLDQRANLANYQAQGQALGQLGGFNMARNSQITDASRYLGGLLEREEFVQPQGQTFVGAGGFQYMPQQRQQQAPLGFQGQGYRQQPVQDRAAFEQRQQASRDQQAAMYQARTAATQAAMRGAVRPGGGTGTGYVQLAGQPQTRLTSGYPPPRPAPARRSY